MRTYRIRYTTLQRRRDGVKDIVANSTLDALKIFHRSCRSRNAESVHLGGDLVWHIRTGEIDAYPSDRLIERNAAADLPRWSLDELKLFLDGNEEYGVFATGRMLYATDDRNSGQRDNLKALLRYRDVFTLVREGRLVMCPVLYQAYWMYEQPEAGIGDASDHDALFPARIPELTRPLFS